MIKLGTNVARFAYFNTQFPTVDVHKYGSPWFMSDKSAPDLDENGWLKSLPAGVTANTILLHGAGVSGPAPSGTYVITFAGKGVIRISDGHRIIVPQSGDTFEVTAKFSLSVVSTEAADYLRDISISRVDEGNVWRNDFIKSLLNFGALRFMECCLPVQTKGPPALVPDWTTRPLLTNRTWTTDKGMPIEAMCHLSNVLSSNPWFNISHQASDNYISNFAALVGMKLNPALKVYVEHSNEVWNTQFQQSVDCKAKAMAQGLDVPEYHAKRTGEIGDIFKEVFGADRVVSVLGSFAAMPWFTTKALNYRKPDALAVAPYFGFIANKNNLTELAALDVDGLFAKVRAEAFPRTALQMVDNIALAKAHGIPCLAYEGGQHMLVSVNNADTPKLLDLFAAFNRDPRMKQLYLDYFALWDDAGGDLFCHYNNCQSYGVPGYWGAQENIYIPSAKQDAILSLLQPERRVAVRRQLLRRSGDQ